MAIITEELIELGKSDRGGWSYKQFELLGLSYPPRSGWKTEITGKEISEETALLFVSLKNKHFKKQLSENMTGNLLNETSCRHRESPKIGNDSPSVIIYTDGSCITHARLGGWAAILKFQEHAKEISGKEHDTTSNRMEMTAAIKALEALKRPCKVKLHSDSQPLVNTMTLNWKRKANKDLWMQLDHMVSIHQVEWIWVKGHAGDLLNNRVDELANAEAKSFETP